MSEHTVGRITFASPATRQGLTEFEMTAAKTRLERDALKANLAELYRLYLWRFELAKMEEAASKSIVAGERTAVKRLLAQYGREKKAAWEVTAKLLGPCP